MADPIRERILAHCRTSLLAINGAGAYHYDLVDVVREEVAPTDLAGLPAARLSEGEETIKEGPYPCLTRWLSITVEAWAHLPAVAPDTAANRLLADIERALTADPTRGGLAVNTTPTGNSVEVNSGTFSTVLSVFEILYQTRRGDPASLA